ncbi:hypothetical protein BZA05DRAFT_83731 [Tricharina praecox]|uniref:uncharacterized protein n=1 Tax=Tricharina praecox TaxID=43433 RepID=UPI00222062A0|nr:uncharacterized protein BZA05DRAFT_83731 [Tricharina praecox]KAI5849136.1 hypothetical protein BZA05DRAFT_83731 [Tricharina praecox]
MEYRMHGGANTEDANRLLSTTTHHLGIRSKILSKLHKLHHLLLHQGQKPKVNSIAIPRIVLTRLDGTNIAEPTEEPMPQRRSHPVGAVDASEKSLARDGGASGAGQLLFPTWHPAGAVKAPEETSAPEGTDASEGTSSRGEDTREKLSREDGNISISSVRGPSARHPTGPIKRTTRDDCPLFSAAAGAGNQSSLLSHTTHQTGIRPVVLVHPFFSRIRIRPMAAYLTVIISFRVWVRMLHS